MKIIYKNQDDTIGILTPTEEALRFVTIEQIAAKDVPAGLPYWIVEDDVIPTDRIFRNAWEADVDLLGAEHGVGSESNQFTVEVLEKFKGEAK